MVYLDIISNGIYCTMLCLIYVKKKKFFKIKIILHCNFLQDLSLLIMVVLFSMDGDVNCIFKQPSF